MSQQVKFLFGTKAQIVSTPIANGHLYYASDINCIAYDLNGVRYYIEEDNILYDSTENWSAKTSFLPEKGQIIIYSDTHVDEQNNYIPGIKIGDGFRYVVDLPFITKKYDDLIVSLNNHIENTAIHVTEQEKQFLCNSAITCLYSDSVLSFTTFNEKGNL